MPSQTVFDFRSQQDNRLPEEKKRKTTQAAK